MTKDRIAIAADKLEIQEILSRYAQIVDARQWKRLDEVFEPGAVIDFTRNGGERLTYPAIIEYLERSLSIFVGILISPMIIPGVITALGLFLFYSPLGLAGNLFGLILAHTILGIPFAVITMTAAMVGFDANLMRAAFSLGASPLVAYRRVMVPLLMPALASSALFVFVTSFDEFIVTSFLAGPEQYTLPLQMWSGVHDDVTPAILAAATLFVFASVLMLICVEVLRRRAERVGGIRVVGGGNR